VVSEVRLWDVLFLLRLAIGRSDGGPETQGEDWNVLPSPSCQGRLPAPEINRPDRLAHFWATLVLVKSSVTRVSWPARTVTSLLTVTGSSPRRSSALRV
jgi:hypothetical protein